MPTSTYVPLATVTASADAAEISFTSISQSYRDLVLVCDVKASAGTPYGYVRFNDDAGANYGTLLLYGDGSSGARLNNTYNQIYLLGLASMTTSESVISVTNIMDYSVTNKHKTVIHRGNRAGGATEIHAIRWASTSAITKITVFPSSDGFAANSTCTLYGIAS